jgi:hypothetical protein
VSQGADRRDVEPSVALRHAGQSVIHDFFASFFGSVTVTRFEWNGRGDDEAVIAALTKHCGHPGQCPSDKWLWWCHLGPIAPAAFDRIEPDEAVATVESFCALCAPLGGSCPAEILDQVASSATGPLRASACYRLRDLPEALLEFTFVDEFRELVALNRRDGVVLLVMMAMD